MGHQRELWRGFCSVYLLCVYLRLSTSALHTGMQPESGTQ